MSSTIHVAPAAREAYQTLEPALREEMREHGVRIIEDPINLLRRSRPPSEPAGLWAYEYESRVIEGLRFVLFLSGLDDEPSRLVLSRISHRMMPEEP